MPAPETEGFGSPNRLKDFGREREFLSNTINTRLREFETLARVRLRGQDTPIGSRGSQKRGEITQESEGRGGRNARPDSRVSYDGLWHTLEEYEGGWFQAGGQIQEGPGGVREVRLLRQVTTPTGQSQHRPGVCLSAVRLIFEGGRGPRSENHGNRVEWKGKGAATPSSDLSAQLKEFITRGEGTTHVLGVGNPIKQDDGVGIEVVSSLRRRLGFASRKGVKLHASSSNPEGLISNLASKGEKIMVIDAVEAQKDPGAIVCARLSETKFGFFATHNIPLKLIPGVAENAAEILLVGIQPDSVGVGEGLSDVVKKSSTRLVEMIASVLEESE